MGEKTLVIGGTGPTGLPLVRQLVARGHDVVILHRGLHERPETPPQVRHAHVDPYDDRALESWTHGRSFDTVIAMYGRLRRIAGVFRGHAGRFMSVGGVPAYRGWMNPFLDPLPLPVPEDAPLVREPSDDEKGYRIVRTEEAVFEAHPDATHFRYPYVYGPHQLAPREWCIVRRIRDGRRRIVVADDGLTLHHHGYTDNLAYAIVLAVEQPDASRGAIYNVGDNDVLTIREVIVTVAAALDHDFEIISMPHDLAVPARPLLMQPSSGHRVLDLARIRNELGYRDAVAPREALATTARWLAQHPPERGGVEEHVLTDPFDYDAEDRLIDGWLQAREAVPAVTFAVEPGYGLAYSGPGGRPRSNAEFRA